MTFAQLQYLLEIHRAGSVSQAAKNLFVSQPSISLTLKALEEELGYPIFLRTRKGLLPTPQGAAVIDHATRICESYQLLTTPQPQQNTFVRISSASIAPVQNAFMRLIEENKDRRDISFSLTQEKDCRENLRNFTLEIGFMLAVSNSYLSRQDAIAKQGLSSHPIATLPGAIRIGKGHRLFTAEHISPEDLENDMFLDSSNSTVSKALLRAGITRIKPNYNIICSQHTVRNDLVLRGLAYDISFYLPEQKHETDFRYIPLEGLSYKLLAITNPLRPPVPEVERFTALVEEELQLAGLGI